MAALFLAYTYVLSAVQDASLKLRLQVQLQFSL